MKNNYSPQNKNTQSSSITERACLNKIETTGSADTSLENKCKYLKQERPEYPPYCLKEYCEKQFNYANVKYCREKLE